MAIRLATEADLADVGLALLAEVRRWASASGCSQLIVVAPSADDARRELLDQLGLHSTSEWWTGAV